MVAEVIGGLLSGSLALLADAGHMLTDTASLSLAWFAARLAHKPADMLRSYGFYRVQILAAFLNGVFFILLVIWIFVEAVQRIREPVEVMGTPMLIVASLGLLVNLLAFWVLHRGDHGNLNMRAASLHVLGDLLGSVAAIAAAIIILLTGWMPIDPVLSVLVALLILNSAIRVVRDSTHILIEGTPQDIDVQTINDVLVKEIPCVTNVHHVHVWSLTPDKPMMTLHVNIQADTDPVTVLKKIKHILKERFKLKHTTIQIEYAECIDEILE